jgi:hypothetical protein
MLLGFCAPTSAQTCDQAALSQMTQPAGRPDFAIDRQKMIAQQLASASFGAIALGDSIMAGWPADYLQSIFGGPTLTHPLIFLGT